MLYLYIYIFIYERVCVCLHSKWMSEFLSMTCKINISSPSRHMHSNHFREILVRRWDNPAKFRRKIAKERKGLKDAAICPELSTHLHSWSMFVMFDCVPHSFSCQFSNLTRYRVDCGSLITSRSLIGGQQILNSKNCFFSLLQVVLGDMGTGKTSLVLRFVKGQFFDHQVFFLHWLYI